MKLLFLDDIRQPFYSQETYSKKTLLELIQAENPEFDGTDIVIVRTFSDFCEYIEDNPIPDIVSFDYMLDSGRYARSGAHCASVLAHECKERGVALPKTYCHTGEAQYADEINRNLNRYNKL